MGYYLRQGRILVHHAVYDRALDALERWPSGRSRTVAADDIAGPPGRLQDRRYEAFPRLPLLWSLAALGIDPAGTTFVDYGAGRGRALLTAARLPFARCIGVEYSASLHAEARDNIAAHPPDRLACRDVSVVHMNAADFVPPAGDLVLFFYNPFGLEVLERVADRIAEAAAREPRAIRIVYVNPRRWALFAGRPAFRRQPIPLAARAKLALL
ncbi:class I SAM-dependent methyltransferase, partial [Rhodoplanes sp. TEM]